MQRKTPDGVCHRLRIRRLCTPLAVGQLGTWDCMLSVVSNSKSATLVSLFTTSHIRYIVSRRNIHHVGVDLARPARPSYTVNGVLYPR